MTPLVQLIIVIPFVVVFAIIVVALMQQQSERLHSLDAAYGRRLQMRVHHSPVRPIRVHEEPAESHEAAPPVRHAA